MKKSKIIKALIIVIVAAGILTFLYVAGSDESVTPSYFVWADKTINVFDVRNRETKIYSAGEYNCQNIDKYYGGDFCCIGEKESNSYALLFKDGKIKDIVKLPFKPGQIVAYHSYIIASCEDKLYRINAQTLECEFLADASYSSFYVNENGDIAFYRDNGKEEEFPVSSLYVYSDNTESYIGEVHEIFYWQSNNELVIREFDGVFNNKTKFSDYIVNIDDKSKKKTNDFKKVNSIKSWKQGSTAVTKSIDRFSLMYSPYMGLVCIDSKFFNHSNHYTDDVVNVLDVYGTLEWFEENPLEQQET